MNRFRYTAEMIEWLCTNAPGARVRDLTENFNREFNSKKTYQQIRSALKNNKIRTGVPGGLPKGTCLTFDSDQVDFIKRSYIVLSLTELTIAFNNTFPDQTKTECQIRSFTRNHRIRSGRSGRFEKGSISWNKGKSYQPGGKSNETQFKKGHRPENTTYEGHERLSKDGYVLVSVNQRNPHTGFHRHYVLKHRYIWEKTNGPIPEDMCLKFVDGNRQNCDLRNMVLISRSLLPALQWMGYEDAPKLLKEVILNTAKLRYLANKSMQVIDNKNPGNYDETGS